MKQIALPRFISEGMVLKRGNETVIKGRSIPNDRIKVTFCGRQYEINTSFEGYFIVKFDTLVAGGPHQLTFDSCAFGITVIKDVYIGEVFVASGQSNMELPMGRVKPQFTEEWKKEVLPYVRFFKVSEGRNFYKPLEDVTTGSWVVADKEHIDEVSAVSYFFAQSFAQEFRRFAEANMKMPIGVIHVALGGSPIQAWLPASLIEERDREKLAPYLDEGYLEHCLIKNDLEEQAWYQMIKEEDKGLRETPWFEATYLENAWQEIKLPTFFENYLSPDFCGVLWFRKTFMIETLKEDELTLLLGTIVDVDQAYINGNYVGETPYQYPPRRYPLSPGILKEGLNQITVRVIVGKGHGRFTPGKFYGIKGEKTAIDLSGIWHYQIGCQTRPMPERDFISWKPTGLHNGMLAPCFSHSISGFMWYQGESNTAESESYDMYLSRFVQYVRQSFKQPALPFYIVQLANYDIDIPHGDLNWPKLREAQRLVAKQDNCGLVVGLDIGENNDIHPLDKKTVGQRLAHLALHDLVDAQAFLPLPSCFEIHKLEDESMVLTFQPHNNKLGRKWVNRCYPELKVSDTKEMLVYNFEITLTNDQIIAVDAEIIDVNLVKLVIPGHITQNEIKEIRYAFSNNPTGWMLVDQYQNMLSPFVLKL